MRYATTLQLPQFSLFFWGNFFPHHLQKSELNPIPTLSARAVHSEVFRSVDYLLAFSQTSRFSSMRDKIRLNIFERGEHIVGNQSLSLSTFHLQWFCEYDVLHET